MTNFNCEKVNIIKVEFFDTVNIKIKDDYDIKKEPFQESDDKDIDIKEEKYEDMEIKMEPSHKNEDILITDCEVNEYPFGRIKEEEYVDINAIQEERDYEDVSIKKEELNFAEYEVEKTSIEDVLDEHSMSSKDNILSISENISLNKKYIKRQNISENFGSSDGKSSHGNCNININSSDSNVVSVGSDGSFICNKCNFKTSHHLQMMLHIEGHEVESSVECIESAHNSTSKSDKKYQYSRKTSLECNYCDYCASSKFKLNRHIRTHTGDKPFKCSFCDYASSQKGCLNEHVRIHTGEKPCTCSYCDYKTSSTSNLRKHVRIHTVKKTFTCRLCDYCTSDKSHLKIHKRNHTIKCGDCDYATSRHSNLKRHVRTQHSPSL